MFIYIYYSCPSNVVLIGLQGTSGSGMACFLNLVIVYFNFNCWLSENVLESCEGPVLLTSTRKGYLGLQKSNCFYLKIP